jgi:hypothetical protein
MTSRSEYWMMNTAPWGDVLLDAATAHRLAGQGDVAAGREYLLGALDRVHELDGRGDFFLESLVAQYERVLHYYDEKYWPVVASGDWLCQGTLRPAAWRREQVCAS